MQNAGLALVLGTGTMGPGIAEMFALGGWRTVLWGRTDRSVASGLDQARLAGARLEDLGLLERGRAEQAEGLLSGSTNIESAAAGADFVVESIVEDLEAKKECFRLLGGAARPEAILATNTSGLSVTALAAEVDRPERVAGMHWWNPPYLIPLVEVVMGEGTSERTADEVARVARELGKLPVVVRKDVPGFIGNRLQYAVLREALSLVSKGVASAADVDLAMRAGPGLRYAAMGPLETLDFMGVDVAARVMDYLFADLDCSARKPAAVSDMLKAGRLGVKRGRGFYEHPGPEESAARRDKALAALLLAGMGR